jgi:hypothetical protein
MNYLPLRIIICISILTVSNILVGQEIDFGKMSVSEVENYEKSQNTTVVDTLPAFGILKNPHFDLETLVQTKTLIYKRNDDDFELKLHVWYHFNDDWTELKGKRYHWGLYNPSFNSKGNEEWLRKLTKKEKVFRAKYLFLEEKLKSVLGEPIKKKTIADNENAFIENIFWEDDVKIVGLALCFDRKLQEFPGIGLFPKFKIEVMITYK